MKHREQKGCRPGDYTEQAYQLGLVSVSFRKNTPEDILSKMKAAGLSFIEWGSDIHAPKDDAENLRNLAELQETYGIECCSYGTYFRLGVTPLEELNSYIDGAKVLGTDILRLWCGNRNSEEYTKEEQEELFAVCRKAAEIAKKRQVILCMECHNDTFTNTKESALELMKAVDSEHFRMYWQPNQFKEEAENLAYAKLLSEYTKHVHVFCWKEHEKFPLKEGVETWKRYLEQLGGEHFLLLEFMPDDRLESLKEEARALFEIAGK